MELFEWCDKGKKQILLDLINHWWLNETAPEELFNARVVPIYKKGETDKADNDMQISLLSSFYKIYMTLIRKRIQKAIEPNLSKNTIWF